MLKPATLLVPLALAAMLPSPALATWVGPVGNPVAGSVNGCPTALIPDGAGGVLVAYQGAPVPGGGAIRLLRVTGDGEVAVGWPADGAVACSLATTVSLGTLRGVSDDAGGAFLVWLESYDPVASQPGTAYVQHVLASGSRASGWPSRGRLLAAAGGQLALNALPDGAGGVIASWRDTRGGQVADIRVTRVNANGANHVGFPAAGLILSEAVPSASMQDPALAEDGTSGYWLSYTIASDDTLASPSSNRLVHLLSSGTLDPDWSGNGFGTPTVVDVGVVRGTAPLADGAGGAYLLSAGVADDVWLQHVLGDGSSDPGWPAEGVEMGTAEEQLSQDRSYQLASDGAGGIFAAWTTPNSGFPGYSALALRRVRADGSLDPKWPGPQLLVGNWAPTLLADAAGVFVCGTWFYTCPHRECSGISGIGRRSADGSIPAAWAASSLFPSFLGQYGTPTPDSCQAAGPVSMVSDGASGVFAAWTKPLTGFLSGYLAPATVRVMRFSALGPVADVAPGAGGASGAGLHARWVAGSGVHATLAPSSSARRLELCDVLGRRLSGVEVPPATTEITLSGTGELRPGLYLVRVRTRSAEAHAKVFVVR